MILTRIIRVFVIVCLLVASTGVLAKSKKAVNCDKSKKNDQTSLQKAINKAKPGATISVKGTCDGISLLITQSGLTLRGPADLVGSGTAPVIRVQDAGDVTLQDLAVSNGTVGIEASNARVVANNIVAENNVVDGFSSLQNSWLTCIDCRANNNGNRGMLVVAAVTLCGDTEISDNTISGALVFLGGKMFSSTGVCGGTPSITMSGNPTGMVLFQNGSVFFDEVELDHHSNENGISVVDGGSLTVRRSNILLDNNSNLGLFITQNSSVKLNDDAASIAVGNTSIQNNAFFGVIVNQNSQITLGNATVAGSAVLDLLVEDFSIANSFGASTVNLISCEPGQSSGNLCP